MADDDQDEIIGMHVADIDDDVITCMYYKKLLPQLLISHQITPQPTDATTLSNILGAPPFAELRTLPPQTLFNMYSFRLLAMTYLLCNESEDARINHAVNGLVKTLREKNVVVDQDTTTAYKTIIQQFAKYRNERSTMITQKKVIQ